MSTGGPRVIDEIKVRLAEARGIDIIVAAMRKHLYHAGVQKFGCRVLMNFAYSGQIQDFFECK